MVFIGVYMPNMANSYRNGGFKGRTSPINIGENLGEHHQTLGKYHGVHESINGSYIIIYIIYDIIDLIFIYEKTADTNTGGFLTWYPQIIPNYPF